MHIRRCRSGEVSRAYDVQHIEKPVRRSQDHLVSEFTHAGSDTGFSLSIAELLKDVKDNNGVPYINEDGALNVNFSLTHSTSVR